MIDAETARTGLEALGVAIAEIIEDAHELAVLATPVDLAERDRRIVALQILGEDVAALAIAMAVLSRRSTTKDP